MCKLKVQVWGDFLRMYPHSTCCQPERSFNTFALDTDIERVDWWMLQVQWAHIQVRSAVDRKHGTTELPFLEATTSRTYCYGGPTFMVTRLDSS